EEGFCPSSKCTCSDPRWWPFAGVALGRAALGGRGGPRPSPHAATVASHSGGKEAHRHNEPSTPGEICRTMGSGGEDKNPKDMGKYGTHFYLCVFICVCPRAPSRTRAGKPRTTVRSCPGSPLAWWPRGVDAPARADVLGRPARESDALREGRVCLLQGRDDHTDIETLQVKVGEWACEETLWSKVSLLSRPLTASTLGCELITILPSEFQMLTRIHPPALRFCVSYASVFIKSFNCASKDPNYRNLLFNDFQETSNMVMEACTGLDDHLSNKQGTRYQVSQSKKNLLRVGRSRRGSRES
ncbi:unnamed protein product, partial [Prorocentrum cordatum]